MSLKKILLIFLFLSLFSVQSKSAFLSEQAKISLITIGPGEDLYSSFGHSAFWVYDPVTHFDRIYNYGTFDFNQPNFYIKFIRGKLLYSLSIGEMRWLMEGAIHENRGVIEQVLNLDAQAKDSLFDFLETNYLPQNREYKYDFFFDNCSTRMRDALKKVYGPNLTFHLKVGKEKSFRRLLDPFLLGKQWQDMGMDIGLGTPADKKATSFDYMYLPEFLMKGFASATIAEQAGSRPLVKYTKTLFSPVQVEKEGVLLSPSLFFWGLFLLTVAITFYQVKTRKSLYSLDIILLVVTGLLGRLILFLWFGTDHYVTRNNWNIIWANPLNLIAAFLLTKQRAGKLTANYFLTYSLLLILLLFAWKLLPQELNLATFPFILLLTVRSLFIFYKLRLEKKKALKTS